MQAQPKPAPAPKKAVKAKKALPVQHDMKGHQPVFHDQVSDDITKSHQKAVKERARHA